MFFRMSQKNFLLASRAVEFKGNQVGLLVEISCLRKEKLKGGDGSGFRGLVSSSKAGCPHHLWFGERETTKSQLLLSSEVRKRF